MKINVEKLLSEIERAGLNQYTFAEKIKKRQSTVSTLLKNRTTTLKTLTKIGKVFNMDPKDLLVS